MTNNPIRIFRLALKRVKIHLFSEYRERIPFVKPAPIDEVLEQKKKGKNKGVKKEE